jgi:hypothetical protein
MEKPKVVASYRVHLSNTTSYLYHIARITEARNVDLSRAHFKEEPGNVVRMTAEQDHKILSFTGKCQGNKESNTSCYLALFKRPTGEYSAIPVKDWFNFQKEPNYKTLTTEQAEEFVSKARNFRCI